MNTLVRRPHEQLKTWLLQNCKKQGVSDITYDTNIIEERIITSVQTFDLITFIERLVGEQIDLSEAKPGTFHTIGSICKAFFPQVTIGEIS